MLYHLLSPFVLLAVDDVGTDVSIATAAFIDVIYDVCINFCWLIKRFLFSI